MMTLEEYMKMPWDTEVHAEEVDDQVFIVATHRELFSCRGQGSTPQEALDDLANARREMLTMMIEFGDSIPIPPLAKGWMAGVLVCSAGRSWSSPAGPAV